MPAAASAHGKASERAPVRRSNRLARAATSAAQRQHYSRSRNPDSEAARLSGLERLESGTGADSDALPEDDDDDDHVAPGDSDFGAARGRRRGRGTRASRAAPRRKCRRRTLEEVMEEEEEKEAREAESEVTFFSCEIGPSTMPARPLCGVCLCLGRYACPVCEGRFCSVKCGKTHKEALCRRLR
eukprot:gnl/TRDRNA2_/TRDRNA2_35642_c0_seq2.p2 gnl/TRDRNA2_/TRDRNA2_35642_c0~~gnl/TRDRNA2_/TRDRNA2_35642_c0_seq2.p2  ORF type:complete len:196 (-),score=27.08 gnl/TRDRNA2_/TRDRNA2_35642_c0_seq2:147-701(-)